MEELFEYRDSDEEDEEFSTKGKPVAESLDGMHDTEAAIRSR